MTYARKRKGMPRNRMGDIIEDLGGTGGMGSRSKTVRSKKKSTAKQSTSKKKTKSAKPIKEVQSKDMARALKNQKRDKTQKRSEEDIVGDYYAKQFDKTFWKDWANRKQTITKKEAAELEKGLNKLLKKDSRHPGRKTRPDRAYSDRGPISGARARRAKKK